jgi:O-antigen/teichoic acid export membrane protein
MPSARRVLRNTSVQVGAELVSKVASLVLYAVLARKLGRVGFGEFIFAFSLAALLTAFAGPGTDDVLTREVARDRSRLAEVFWAAMSLKVLLGGLAVLLAVAIAGAEGDPARLWVAIGALALTMLLEALAKTFHATFVAFEDLAPAATSLLVERLLTTFGGIVVVLLGGGIEGVALVFLAGSVAGLAYPAWVLARRWGMPRMRVSRPELRWLLVTAIPLGINGIFTMVLFRVDTLILNWLDTDAAVGLYGSAYRVLDATLFISFSFVTAMIPTLARARTDSHPSVAEVYASACKALVVLLFPIGATLALFAGPIVHLLYGGGFDGAVTALRLLGGAVALFGVSYLSTATLVYQHHQGWVPWLTGGLVVFNVALNFALIPRWSLNGAAFATAATEAARALVAGALVWRAAGRIPVARVALGPVLGCLAMTAAWALLGASLAVIPVAVVAYVAVLLAVEQQRHPHDLRLVLDAVLRRGSAVA